MSDREGPLGTSGEAYLLRAGTPESRAFVARVAEATRLSVALSALDPGDAEGIRRAFEELIGGPVGTGFRLVPPFYADHGLNISVGRDVVIGYDCTMTGHAPITLGDGVLIAHKVNLVTAGHPVAPDVRRSRITGAPVTLGRNVWVGAGATILPGVTVGADAVVAAGAVVTHDVPPGVVVAGVPARVVRRV